jgi:hypothetical protein
MESVFSFYSAVWYSFMVGGLTLVGMALFRVLESVAHKNGDTTRGVMVLILAASLVIIGAAESNPPYTNVIQLSPGEELVGSCARGQNGARVIVRLEDGQYSVRDVILPKGKELEIRSSSRIEK